MALNARGFVTYENVWWPGCILTVNEKLEATVSVHHPYGPSPSFLYPQQPDVVIIPLSEIICTTLSFRHLNGVLPVAKLLSTHSTGRRREKCMPRVGFRSDDYSVHNPRPSLRPRCLWSRLTWKFLESKNITCYLIMNVSNMENC